MATYSEVGSGAALLSNGGVIMATYSNSMSGGAEGAGRAYIPNSDNYNYQTVGSSCTKHSSTTNNEYFCCLLGHSKRSATWKKMNGAYVCAITVCEMRLF